MSGSNEGIHGGGTGVRKLTRTCRTAGSIAAGCDVCVCSYILMLDSRLETDYVSPVVLNAARRTGLEAFLRTTWCRPVDPGPDIRLRYSTALPAWPTTSVREVF
jgi:hypothetical protein